MKGAMDGNASGNAAGYTGLTRTVHPQAASLPPPDNSAVMVHTQQAPPPVQPVQPKPGLSATAKFAALCAALSIGALIAALVVLVVVKPTDTGTTSGVTRPQRVITAASVQHEWSGTRLRFRNPDGSWGQWVDLRGSAGPSGANGTAGADGADGSSGADGSDGATGSAGPAGPTGPTGPAGDDGPPGADGNNTCVHGKRDILSVVCFGATGDGSTDDTAAFQATIDAAAPWGATVEVPVGQYRLTQPLRVPKGVMIAGHSMGTDPLQMLGWRGSVLMAYHDSWAVVIEGSLAGVRDVAIVDPPHTAAGGILCNGTGRGLESLRFHSVLVLGFTSGTAVMLQADLGGAVTYSTFFDVRVRNAKIGIHTKASGVDFAFVNSNSFYHGAVSGGGFDYGILVEGPGPNNNNIFIGTIVEPPVSTYGHLVVGGSMSQIIGIGIRIEGSAQDLNVPMISLAPETDGSVLTGLFAGGPVDVNPLNHDYQIMSGKSIGADTPATNVLDNACLLGGSLPVVTTSTNEVVVPFWQVSASGIRVERLPRDDWLVPGHAVLNITVPAGVTAQLTPESGAFATRGTTELSRVVNVGAYVLASESDSVFFTIIGPTGVTSSAFHAGNGKWSFLGMTGRVETPAGVRTIVQPKLWLDNSAGTSSMQVLVSVPTLRYGVGRPVIGAATVTAAGGIMTGSLTLGLVDVYPPASGNFWTLPPGNTFRVHSTTAIHRINHLGPDRFVKGTRIVLLFQEAGLSVLDSVYVDTVSSYVSAAGSSLTLLSMDAGTWVELSRSGV